MCTLPLLLAETSYFCDSLFSLFLYMPICCAWLVAIAAAWDHAVVSAKKGLDTTHRLRFFSPILTIVLSFATCGLFASCYFALVHGRLPRNRDNDPSAGTAIGLMFVPIVNLYWMPFVLLRLVVRVNEQLNAREQRPTSAHKILLISFVAATLGGAQSIRHISGGEGDAIFYLALVCDGISGLLYLAGIIDIQKAINRTVTGAPN